MAKDPSKKRKSDRSGSEAKQMPEGMRVRRKKREGGARQTLFLKQRDVLREMDVPESAPMVGVKEQVDPLKSARRSKGEEKPVEERWGGRAHGGHGGGWLVLIGLFALAIPVLAICTAFILAKGKKGQELNLYDEELILNVEPEGSGTSVNSGPLAWFIENPHGAYDGAVNLLEKLNDQAEARVSPDYYRHPESTLAKIAERGLGWTSTFSTADPREFSWSTGKARDTGFLVFEGLREDKSKFRTYFVMTDKGLRLDWKATTGFGDVPFEKLVNDAASDSVRVRCHLLKEPHFDTQRGDPAKQSWYLLRSPAEDANIWGYAKTDSVLDKKLRRLFGYGMIVLERVPQVRATLQIVKPETGAGPKEYRIERLFAKEWVIPENLPDEGEEAGPAVLEEDEKTGAEEGAEKKEPAVEDGSDPSGDGLPESAPHGVEGPSAREPELEGEDALVEEE